LVDYTKEHPELANKKEFVAKAWQIAHRDWAKMQMPPKNLKPSPQNPQRYRRLAQNNH
jgi:hypothetical protein